MNFKVRLKNKAFWLGVIPATITFIYSVLASFDIVPGISEAVLIKIATNLISALALLGVFVDPTTDGVKDSQRAMTYTKPWKDLKTLFNVQGREEDDLK